MNPFDLPGPSFLAFYWTLALACLLIVFWLRLRSDVAGPPTQMASDPCLLAYLRDGYPEAVRVALLTLIDEGVVLADRRVLALAPEETRPKFQPQRTGLEKELVSFLAKQPATADQLVARAVGYDACLGYRLTLEEFGYVRRDADLARGRRTVVGVAILLAAVAIIKMTIAIGRGHRNIGFLVLSAITVVIIAVPLWRWFRRGVTTRGEHALDAAEALLDSARWRLKNAGAALHGPELAWIAAAFGFSVFARTSANFAFWPALASETRYRPEGSGRLASSSSCSSSSCSTSVSSCGGGGSSCGGGGCGGGGCGGCGGG